MFCQLPLSRVENTKLSLVKKVFSELENLRIYYPLDDENQIQPYNSTALKKSADVTEHLQTSHETDKKTELNPDNDDRENNHDTCAPDEQQNSQKDKNPRERKVICEPNDSNTKENGVIPDIVTEM